MHYERKEADDNYPLLLILIPLYRLELFFNDRFLYPLICRLRRDGRILFREKKVYKNSVKRANGSALFVLSPQRACAETVEYPPQKARRRVAGLSP